MFITFVSGCPQTLYGLKVTEPVCVSDGLNIPNDCLQYMKLQKILQKMKANFRIGPKKWNGRCTAEVCAERCGSYTELNLFVLNPGMALVIRWDLCLLNMKRMALVSAQKPGR